MTFKAAAKHYGLARPTYATEAIMRLLRNLRLEPGSQVIDLGAGTGIFARQLAAHGMAVTAVEPEETLRAQIPAADGVTVCAGTAEDTRLPSTSADAVFAATAWHRFDGPRVLTEVRRLLRPGSGGLGLIFNEYDESIPWLTCYARIADSRRPVSSPSARSGAWRRTFEQLSDWEPLQHASCANPWPTTAHGLIERLLSSSAIAGLSEPERIRAVDEAQRVIDEFHLSRSADLVLPYRTSTYWTRPTSRKRSR